MHSTTPARETGRSAFLGLGLVVARVAAVAAATVLAWALLRTLGYSSGFPPTSLVASLALIPVNIATLLAVRAVVHRRGGRLRDLLGFDRSRLAADIAWGLLWLVVLYLPFAATVIGTMFALHGARAFERFETVFVPEAVPEFSAVALVVLGAIAVLTFAPLNAPAEELAFRGLAQGDLARGGRRLLALLLPALVFAAQHLFFAPSASAMIVFGAAFLVWGLGAALIYSWQRRLVPLVVSHFLVNLGTTVPAVVVPLVIPESLS